MLFVSTAFAAGLPAIEVERRRDGGRLYVIPPAGEHVAPEAPADGWLAFGPTRVDIALPGEALGHALPIPLDLGQLEKGEQPWFAGELRFSLCEDGGTTCRVVDVGFAGEIARRGRSDLPTHAVEHEAEATDLFTHWSTPDEVEQAFVQAAASGQRVLLDFSAEWCPPCNLLAAEVLHAEQHAPDLEGFQVLMLDADHPDSFTYKDRYDIGGYPTMVVATPDGDEVGRLVGYPGESETLAWLDDMTSQATLADVLAGLDAVSDDDAGALALELYRQGHEEEAAALAARATDGVEARTVRLATEEAVAEHLAWLVEHAPDRWEDWLWEAYGPLQDTEPELQDQVAGVLEAAIATAEPATAADLLYVLAGLTDDDQALYGAAANLLASSLGEDRLADRGHLTFLATLYMNAGAVDEALDVLEAAEADWPDEFTWPYARARHLAALERYEEAELAARAALERGHGDNAIRAAGRLAGILDDLGRTDEAMELLSTTLDATERPEEGLDVRTWRYLEQLEEQLAELENPSEASDEEAG